VTTMPPETLEAYRDHGHPAVRIAESIARAPERLGALAALHIELDKVTRELEVEGVAKFSDSYGKLLHGIETKASALVGER